MRELARGRASIASAGERRVSLGLLKEDGDDVHGIHDTDARPGVDRFTGVSLEIGEAGR